LIDFAGSDLSVVNAARVSFHKESEWEIHPGGEIAGEQDFFKLLPSKDYKLIDYLAKHNHWSPFAHSFLSFRVKAPIFLARQLVKHSVGGMWNEVSRRYVDEEPECFLPVALRSRPESSIKQGSAEDHPYSKQYLEYVKQQFESCLSLYNEMIEEGIAPEQARMILPQNTMTDWIWSGSLAFFARVYKERSNPGAQKEAQEFAAMLSKLIPVEYEHSWKALTATHEERV
jgi:thymidylate synthase (FAD)